MSSEIKYRKLLITYLCDYWFNETWNNVEQMFQRIRKQKPEMLKKVKALSGDVGMKNLGLTDEQLDILINETNIIFHCAATLRLESKLKDAIDMNTVNFSINSLIN